MDERKVKRIYHPPTVPAADLFKGGKERRVAAYARVSTASDEQLNSVEAQKDYFAKLIRQRPDWIFVGVYADEGITGWLHDFACRHNLPHINPHAFRHTVASVLLANGTDIVTVSKQLGHASVNTTENFYSHIIEENKARATECIADVLLRKKA